MAARLRQVLVEQFDMDELEILATDAGARWDNLRGDTLIVRAASLVAWAERHERLLTLMQHIVAARPGVDWKD